MLKMVVDTHTHTIASGHAYSTLNENCTEAARKGIRLLAVTDHGPAMPGGPHIFHIRNQAVLPNYINGVEILRGVEANIIDYNGKLDVDDNALKKLDIVLASLHDVCVPRGNIEENTRALIGAMKNQYVDIIAHPGNPAFPIDVNAVLEAALEYNVMIEINNSSLGTSRPGSLANCKIIAQMAAEKGNLISLGSDAHYCTYIGEFPKAYELINCAGIRTEKIINTSEEKLKDYLRKKGKLSHRK